MSQAVQAALSNKSLLSLLLLLFLSSFSSFLSFAFFLYTDQQLTPAPASSHLHSLIQPKPNTMLTQPSRAERQPIQLLVPSHFGSTDTSATFFSTPRGGPLPEHTPKRKFRLFWLQLVSAIISNLLLVVIVAYALVKRFAIYSISHILNRLPVRKSSSKPPSKKNKNNQQQQPNTATTTTTSTTTPETTFSREWDDPKKFKSEKITKDFNFYAKECGFEIIEQEVETLDGYFLKVWKVVKPNDDRFTAKEGKGGFPVLIQHGLFQSSGSFITSEERSLAFWLAEHGGYQVYLGNNRGIFNMGHRKLKRGDPRFWDYNIKELALYDLPALVDHVLKDTGHDRLAFIGHSQGNATMFCTLASGMIPELGSKLTTFIALAPAVYAGPLTSGFPFGALKSMRWRTWRRFFGILDFLPIMTLCVDWLPSEVFGFLGYQMFAFLFNWTDRNWLLRRKLKMFRFTPSPVSSAGIFWWTGYQGFSTRGCVLDPSVESWWDERFPPLALYHGGEDFLVLADPLLERLKTHEKSVKLIRNFKLEGGEHCDTFWHADAVEICFHLILEDIEKTRKAKTPTKSVVERQESAGHVVEAIGRDEPTNEPTDQAKKVGEATPGSQSKQKHRLQSILCEPSSCDVKTRESIMNAILNGKILDFLGNDIGNVIPLGHQDLHDEIDRDMFNQDRDRYQAPVMHLDRDV